MAWIYLAASEDSLSPWINGFGPSPIVKTIDTHKPLYCLESQVEICHTRLSGTTCERCEAAYFDESISSMEVSPARTSVVREMQKAWKRAVDQDCLAKFSGSLTKYDQLSSSLKMSQRSGHADLLASSANSPPFGMIVGGQLFLPKKLELPSLAKDGSFWPRPVAIDTGTRINQGGGQGRIGKERPTLGWIGANWARPQARDWKDGSNPMKHGTHSDSIGIQAHKTGHKGYLNPDFHLRMMGYPSGWNELNPPVMRWFQSKQKKPSKD